MSAPFILQPAPVVLLQTQLDNAFLQAITAGTDYTIFDATGAPFAMLGASIWYTGASTNFTLLAPGTSIYLKYRNGGDVAAVYQDTLSGTGFLKIDPSNAASFVVNYDPTAPNFGPQFSDSEINIGFDGDYQTGDGVLNVYVWGWYLYA